MNGKTTIYRISDEIYGHPCGCVINVPLIKATKTELEIIADGKPKVVKRLKKFNIEYAELVTKDLKKVVRTWLKPFEIIPFGISKDGKKLYVETSYSDESILNNLKDGLVLEISEIGTFKFVPKTNPNIISKYKMIKSPAKDAENDYLGYLKFSDGKVEL